MGYIIIKYLDISGEKDYKVLKTERLSAGDGEHIFRPVEIEGYENIPFPEPPFPKSDVCNNEWEPPQRNPIPFGSQRVIISSSKTFGYAEFYYKKVSQ